MNEVMSRKLMLHDYLLTELFYHGMDVCAVGSGTPAPIFSSFSVSVRQTDCSQAKQYSENHCTYVRTPVLSSWLLTTSPYNEINFHSKSPLFHPLSPFPLITYRTHNWIIQKWAICELNCKLNIPFLLELILHVSWGLVYYYPLKILKYSLWHLRDFVINQINILKGTDKLWWNILRL